MYMLNQAAFTWGFTVFVDPLAQEFGWSRTSITVAWALSLTWGLLLGPAFGKYFDRYGSRPVIVVGGLLGGLGWLLIPTAHSYWAFAAYFVLLVGTGINGALGPSTGSAAIAHWFKMRRSLALGIYFTGSGGAGLVLIPIMSALTEMYGWRVSAASLGATALLFTAAVAPFMRHKPAPHELDREAGPTSEVTTSDRRPPTSVGQQPPLEPEFTLAEALRHTPFWLFTTAIFLRYVGMGITQVHQMPHMLSRGVDPVTATAALSLSLIVNIPSRIVIGWMGDIYSKKWLLNLTAIAGGFALLAFAFIGPASTELVWVYAILWGIGLAMLPLQAAWVADTYGRANYGSINASSNSFALFGRVVGALAAAFAYDSFGSYSAIMLLGAAGFAIGAIMLMLLPPSNPVTARNSPLSRR
ncbi:MAG TPA: MFS transporter [Burkholderiales bacterium]|nr:MFS transporter [Burkholderiales bacterium]